MADILEIELQTPYSRERERQIHELARLVELDTIPRTIKEWKSHLTKYCSSHSDQRMIYRHLAIDGFRGENPSNYLDNVVEYLQHVFQRHVGAVRRLYDTLNEGPLKQLPGEVSACIVFMALLKCYSEHIVNMDDREMVAIQRSYRNTEGKLHSNANYYRDVRSISVDLLDRLGAEYRAHFDADDQWKFVAEKMVYYLYCNVYSKKIRSSPSTASFPDAGLPTRVVKDKTIKKIIENS